MSGQLVNTWLDSIMPQCYLLYCTFSRALLPASRQCLLCLFTLFAVFSSNAMIRQKKSNTSSPNRSISVNSGTKTFVCSLNLVLDCFARCGGCSIVVYRDQLWFAYLSTRHIVDVVCLHYVPAVLLTSFIPRQSTVSVFAFLSLYLASPNDNLAFCSINFNVWTANSSSSNNYKCIN